MNFLRRHWFDTGIGLAGITGIFLLLKGGDLSQLQLILWLSLISLFIHQVGEYRWPGYFPGMVNAVLYKSDMPDRYPLNSQTSLVINAGIGWGCYFLAAVLAERGIWLGIACILVSCGNIVAHVFLFNIKGKTFYNPGMATALLLFLPIAVFFFYNVIAGSIAGPADWIAGILLGIALNVIGIVKLIGWMADRRTKFVFAPRLMGPYRKM